MKKIISWTILCLILILCVQQTTQAETAVTPSPNLSPAAKLSPVLSQTLAAANNTDMITVVVTMVDQVNVNDLSAPTRADRLRLVENTLRTQNGNAQTAIRGFINQRLAQGHVSQATYFWLFNGLSLTADPATINELAARSDVQSIVPDAIDIALVGTPTNSPGGPNLNLIQASSLWNLGWQGQGIVVASLDSGVDVSHPDLAGRWRGGNNSWYDPYGQHPTTPTDLNGHGTWTMGILVGGDISGTTMGVAPQAKWISVKIFNDQGTATTTAIHLGLQWLLDPDNNPNTADAPQVVNNSWTYINAGCFLDFEPDLQSLRAAGILPVFAAGNGGPNSNTSFSPANNPSALAVGAIDNNSQIYTYSSRGPSSCGGTSNPFPDLVAPGVNILTTDLYGGYYTNTGTSFAAPHVAGGLALLLSAYPNLTVAVQESTLLNSAVDLGAAGADTVFGYGRLDLLAAYNQLASLPTPTPTTAPQPSPTPTPTATSLPSTNTPLPPTPTATYVPPTPTATPLGDLLFADGFEGGSFAAWSTAVTNNGKLSVQTAAALMGTKGMQAIINSTTNMYVGYNALANETSYHARFYFDPNTISMSSNRTHDLFVGRSASGVTLFHLQLRKSNGVYQLRGFIRPNSGSEQTTNWYNLSDAPHAIEIAWLAAQNGSLSLWLDGTLLQTKSGVNTSNYTLTEVRLGPQTIGSGINGTEYYDAFISTRSTYIGP